MGQQHRGHVQAPERVQQQGQQEGHHFAAVVVIVYNDDVRGASAEFIEERTAA
jgi:hypothetical protein